MPYDPDYGIWLKDNGISRQTKITFSDLPLRHVDVVSAGHYCTTAATAVDGRGYAVTFDFDDAILEQIIFLLPDALASTIKPALKTAKGPASFELPGPLRLQATARIGTRQNGRDEQFVPLVIEKISPANERCDPSTSDPELRHHPRFAKLKGDAREHWRRFRPKMVRALEQDGDLDAALDRAVASALKTEAAYLAQGFPEDGAWEAAREHIFLKDEATEEEANNVCDIEAEWLAQKENEGVVLMLPNGRCVSEAELEEGLEDWQFTDIPPTHVIDGPFIACDELQQCVIRVVALENDEIGTEVWNGKSWEQGGSLSQAVRARAPWNDELIQYGIKEENMDGGVQQSRLAPHDREGYIPRPELTLRNVFFVIFVVSAFLALTLVSSMLAYRWFYPREYVEHLFYGRRFDLRFGLDWLVSSAVYSGFIYRRLQGRHHSKKPT